ncbi:MAG TPA: VWA containing CoxE family protein, partial [Saprospiraceae bacterium]|nr:VWA containing CoxE family protein [Saprospiraceae bacterium]
MKRHTSITAHLIAFCRFLRQKGFIIGPEEEAETLLAIELLQPYSDQENFKLALRSVLTRSRKNQIMFDELYAKYWEELAKAQDAKIKELPEE